MSETQKRILLIAQEEFLEKGFKDASLREIVKRAGVTLGAFYGYYPNKEALFNAIVEEAAETLFECFQAIHHRFEMLPAEQQTQDMTTYSSMGISSMFDIIYNNLPIYKLIFFKAAGTRYEDYRQRFIALEVASTHRFIEHLQKERDEIINIDDDLIHILASSMFSGLLEPIDHNMSKEKAKQYIGQLYEFYTAGWYQLMGL